MSDDCFFDSANLAQGIARSLADGLETRIFAGENVMISVVRIAPFACGAVHSHPEEQWGYLIEGSGIRIQDGVDHAVSAGHLWRTPENVLHGFSAGPDGAVILDIFSPPRADYLERG